MENAYALKKSKSLKEESDDSSFLCRPDRQGEIEKNFCSYASFLPLNVSNGYKTERGKGVQEMERKKRNREMEERFLRLLEAEKDRFYRIAYSYMKNQHDALDVIQASVEKAYGKLDQVREPDYLRTWFTRVVINTAKDDLRKRKRMVLVEEDKEMDRHQPVVNLQLEEKLDLKKAFEILNENERIILTLRYFEDRKFQEIESILEKPASTIKSTLYRALKKLRINLEEGVQYE